VIDLGFKWKLIDGIENALMENTGKLTGQLNTTFNTALQTACAKFIENDELKKKLIHLPMKWSISFR
jgi:hypothetical protein